MLGLSEELVKQCFIQRLLALDPRMNQLLLLWYWYVECSKQRWVYIRYLQIPQTKNNKIITVCCIPDSFSTLKLRAATETIYFFPIRARLKQHIVSAHYDTKHMMIVHNANTVSDERCAFRLGLGQLNPVTASALMSKGKREHIALISRICHLRCAPKR